MGMVAPIYYTAEQVRAFPEDGNRYEVVERLVWHPAAAAQAFELSLDELFRPI